MYHIVPFREPSDSTRTIERGTERIDYEQLASHCKYNGATTNRHGYIFYQPGDLHDARILSKSCSGLWIRVGDLHHLWNPLVKTFQFLLSIYDKIEQVSLNTNPAFVPLFTYIFPGCKALPISELTIEDGLLEESRLIAPRSLSKASHLRLAYIGPTESAFHPRRSLWIHRLLGSKDANRIDILPASGPKEWLHRCAEYSTIIAPSLNSQWSHNIFVPNLAGSQIITDCQSLPNYSYYSNNITRSRQSCVFSSSFDAFRGAIRNASRHERIASGEIAENARRHMETSDLTAQNFFLAHNSQSQAKTYPLSLRDPESYLKITIAANVFEVIQETIRLMVNYEMFIAVCQSSIFFRLLSSYFPHPRLLVKYTGSLETEKTYLSRITLLGYNGKGKSEDRLLSLNIEIDRYDTSLISLSSRLFEPCRIRRYDHLQKHLEAFVSMQYKPAEFAQHLVNAVSIEY